MPEASASKFADIHDMQDRRFLLQSSLNDRSSLEIAKELGLEAVETDFTRHDVYTADECFLTGSAAELIPVVAVDAREIGDGKPGPITARILSAFGEFVKNDDN